MTESHAPAAIQELRDEQDIRDLGNRFADACNRDDDTAFRSLWADDSVWIIDEPVNIRTEGADAIARTRQALRAGWDFFVQMPHAPVVTVEGDRANSLWTVSEHAIDTAGGRTYFNYARYDDVLTRTAHGWRYVSRHYRYYHLGNDPAAETVTPPRRPAPEIH